MVNQRIPAFATRVHVRWTRSGAEASAGYNAPWIVLTALASAVAFSFQHRHRTWLRGAGGEVLWVRAVSLGQLELRWPCLQILGAMATVVLMPLLTHAMFAER